MHWITDTKLVYILNDIGYEFTNYKWLYYPGLSTAGTDSGRRYCKKYIYTSSSKQAVKNKSQVDLEMISDLDSYGMNINYKCYTELIKCLAVKP